MKAPSGSIAVSDPQFMGYIIEFRSQVDFLKDLVRMSWVDSPAAETARQQESQDRFYALSATLEKALESLTYEDFKNPSPELTSKLAKVAIFMYVFDKTNEFYGSCVKLNKDGAYAFYDSIRNFASSFLSDNFFGRPAEDIIRVYLLSEAQFVAMAELCGVELLPIHEAAAIYQQRVFDKMIQIIRKKKQASAEGPSPAAKPGKGKKKKSGE